MNQEVDLYTELKGCEDPDELFLMHLEINNTIQNLTKAKFTAQTEMDRQDINGQIQIQLGLKQYCEYRIDFVKSHLKTHLYKFHLAAKLYLDNDSYQKLKSFQNRTVKDGKFIGIENS